MEGITTPPSAGYLELVLGPMWSGKTSHLLDLYAQYNVCSVPVLLVNYTGDEERGVERGTIKSHDGRIAPCCTVRKLSEISNEALQKASVILVNEAQFFPDAFTWISDAVEKHGKRVHAVGLDGDYLRRPFGDWLQLVPLADKLHKQRAFCMKCKCREALFSHRISKECDRVELIGNEDMYQPLCRGCYQIANPEVLQ